MAKVLSPFKKTLDSTSIVKEDYRPFPSFPEDAVLAKVLNSMNVLGVTAKLHFCAPQWKMEKRRINDDMFFYIIRGSGEAIIEGKSFSLLPGVCAHFRRGIDHEGTTNPKNPIHVIAFHYTATVFESITIPELMGFPDTFQIQGDSELDFMFHEACREFALTPPGYECNLEAITTRILLHLIRNYHPSLNIQVHNSKISDLQRLLTALKSMRQNLSNPSTISELARSAGYSEAQFRRVFERTLGMAPIHYLRRIRMEQACWLLRQTSKTLESISEEVGYEEPSFFARSFKKMMGISPGKYRRTYEL